MLRKRFLLSNIIKKNVSQHFLIILIENVSQHFFLINVAKTFYVRNLIKKTFRNIFF
jgi:hypothetical protein